LLTVLPHTQVMVVTSWPITSAVSVPMLTSPVMEKTLLNQLMPADPRRRLKLDNRQVAAVQA
jgi:hypothetical protein